MATLVLNGDPAGALASLRGAAVSMRSWLDGHWALLFSHPDDFLRSELDLDGWVESARRAFDEAEVRPLAVARLGQPPDDGWITRVSGDPRIVVLHESAGDAGERRALRLQEEIAGTGGRFVMIVASDLCPHRTFVYADIEDLPSPIDLIPRIETLRLAINAPPQRLPALSACASP